MWYYSLNFVWIRDKNKNQFDEQLKIIKEQTELLDNLKIAEELNDVLKKDNSSLKEHNDYLEKTHASFMEDFNKLKLSHEEIQEEKEKKIEDMCKKYDDVSFLYNIKHFY